MQAGLPAWAPPRGCTQQRLLDEEGRILGYESHLLAGSSGLSLAETVALIRSLGGLAVASHVDRRSFSVISQLGFLPRGGALRRPGDLGGRGGPRPGRGVPGRRAAAAVLLGRPQPGGGGRRLHGCWTPKQASFAELALALRGEGGRRCGIA